jgi:DNA mismatch repair protein MutL
MLTESDIAKSISEIIDEIKGAGTGKAREEMAVISLVCHSAVKAGKVLSIEEMKELVRQLEETSLPHTCPHGRPTMIHLSQAQLEREFRRR